MKKRQINPVRKYPVACHRVFSNGIKDILKKKRNKEKVTVLTCYDYSFAKILDETDIDMLLVGDSLANVVLGMSQTKNISLTEMLNHTKAVCKAAEETLVVADMPYVAYQKNPKKCVYYAEKFIDSGADAVKIEWFPAKGGSLPAGRRGASGGKDCPYVVKKLIKNKIPVMGHIGLTPQTVHLLGGFKVQGKDKKRAEELIQQAKLLQDLGVFSLVLECLPYQLAKEITKLLSIPTIGIGAGKYCDGQVLVLYDILGLYKQRRPKFVKVYDDLSEKVEKAINRYILEVKKGTFPSIDNSFSSQIK